MKKQFLVAGFVFFSFMLPMRASAAIFSRAFVFGDSTVDNGNFFNATNGIPPEPYFDGRISNGLNWVDFLAKDLGLDITNFAFAGATTGDSNTLNRFLPPDTSPSLAFPGLSQQIGLFLGPLGLSNSQADADALYIISAGGNDYLDAGISDINEPADNSLEALEELTNEPVKNLLKALNALASVGAKNFLIANLPNLGNTPDINNPNVSKGLNILTGLHNSALSRDIQSLSNRQPNLNINLFDVNSLINQIQTDGGKFGFTNVTDSCLDKSIEEIVLSNGELTQCNNPDEYLFWDNIHATTRTNRLIADAALVALHPQSVPEPGVAWGMLAFGALGAAGVLKRKQKKLAFTPASQALVAQSSHTMAEN